MAEDIKNNATNGNPYGKQPRKLRVLLETYGWPMGAVRYEFDWVLGEDSRIKFACLYQMWYI